MNISQDVSNRLDQVTVDLLLAVDGAAASLQVSYCIIGAFARDVVLGLCFGISTGRATRDIDFGLMLDHWAQFAELRNSLLATPDFLAHVHIPHRLTFRGVRELDIVPFGGIERTADEIAWPPDFSRVMSTAGLRQAQARALNITISTGKAIPFASPAALAMLKLIAWSERGHGARNKDAHDLAVVLTTYLQAGNETRLYDEHSALLDEDDFDLEAAGARILGRDLAMLAGSAIRRRLAAILDHGMASSLDEPLIRALPLRYESARRLLAALATGLDER